MSQESYNIPTGPNARYDYQRNLVQRCIAGVTAWGLPAPKITAIATPRSDYEQKFAVANNRSTQNPVATAARDAAWEVYAPLLIDLLNHNILNNTLISPSDKVALNIHINGGNATVPSPAPLSAPIVSLVAEEVSVLHVLYADPSSPAVHSKPANVAFCELAYKLGEPAPVAIADCTERYNIARSHEGIVFAPEQRGKQVYAYARWVNKNGKQGPWSGQVMAIIP
jgi:hypothetical protein